MVNGVNVAKEALMAIENYMDSTAVARKLRISVSAVHRLAARGTLPSTWFAGKRMWTREGVERYLADGELQRRRRNGALISQGNLELSIEQAIHSAVVTKAIDAQRPISDEDGKGRVAI